MKTDLRTEIAVELDIPVTVTGQDGRPASRSRITIRRPKTRHAKRLAALIGADLVSELLGQLPDGSGADGASVDGRRLVADVLPKLMSAERLDALTAIIADMCDEAPATIDDLDLADLFKLARAFLGFFPALQSWAAPASLPN